MPAPNGWAEFDQWDGALQDGPTTRLLVRIGSVVVVESRGFITRGGKQQPTSAIRVAGMTYLVIGAAYDVACRCMGQKPDDRP